MPAKRGRKVGSWTKWPPERFKQAIDLIKAGYNYTEAAEAVGAKRHELTARLIQTNQYIQIRKMRPPVWQAIDTAPKNGSKILGWDFKCGCLIIEWSELFKCWDVSHNDRLDFTLEPTHWMPLPERPR